MATIEGRALYNNSVQGAIAGDGWGTSRLGRLIDGQDGEKPELITALCEHRLRGFQGFVKRD